MFLRLIVSLIVASVVVFGGVFVGFNLITRAPLWATQSPCTASMIASSHLMDADETAAAKAIEAMLPVNDLSATGEPVRVDSTSGNIVLQTSAHRLNAVQQGRIRLALRSGTIKLENSRNAPKCITWTVLSQRGEVLLQERYFAAAFKGA